MSFPWNLLQIRNISLYFTSFLHYFLINRNFNQIKMTNYRNKINFIFSSFHTCNDCYLIFCVGKDIEIFGG